MIMDTMYGTGAGGLCGNDDAGQMSVWYVFSALGLYPVCPGSPVYAVGGPLVERAVVHLESGETLEVRAENQSAENVFVHGIELNGKKLDRPFLRHDELNAGRVIRFTMGTGMGISNENPQGD